MKRQFVVVAYDISSNRRRTKLHDLLLQYGNPVQYSVFECLLETNRLQDMKHAIDRVIRPRVDRIRYYFLCQACLKKVEFTSGPEVLAETNTIIV